MFLQTGYSVVENYFIWKMVKLIKKKQLHFDCLEVCLTRNLHSCFRLLFET